MRTAECFTVLDKKKYIVIYLRHLRTYKDITEFSSMSSHLVMDRHHWTETLKKRLELSSKGRLVKRPRPWVSGPVKPHCVTLGHVDGVWAHQWVTDTKILTETGVIEKNKLPNKWSHLYPEKSAFFFSGKRELRDRCIGKNSPLTFSTLDMSDWMLRTKRLWW